MSGAAATASSTTKITHESDITHVFFRFCTLATEREVLWMCVLVPASRVVGRALMLVAEAHLRCDLPADCRNGGRVSQVPKSRVA